MTAFYRNILPTQCTDHSLASYRKFFIRSFKGGDEIEDKKEYISIKYIIYEDDILNIFRVLPFLSQSSQVYEISFLFSRDDWLRLFKWRMYIELCVSLLL